MDLRQRTVADVGLEQLQVLHAVVLELAQVHDGVLHERVHARLVTPAYAQLAVHVLVLEVLVELNELDLLEVVHLLALVVDLADGVDRVGEDDRGEEDEADARDALDGRRGRELAEAHRGHDCDDVVDGHHVGVLEVFRIDEVVIIERPALFVELEDEEPDASHPVGDQQDQHQQLADLEEVGRVLRQLQVVRQHLLDHLDASSPEQNEGKLKVVDPVFVATLEDALVHDQEEVEAAQNIEPQLLPQKSTDDVAGSGDRLALVEVDRVHLYEDVDEDDDVNPVDDEDDLIEVLLVRLKTDAEWLG